MSAIAVYFEDKPVSREIFEVVANRIEALGPTDVEVKSQVSFGAKRKFAWFWLYNVSKKNPSGILHLMLALGEEVEDSHVRDVSQVGKGRWNHQIVIRTLDDARSDWLGELIERAYRYGSR